VVLYCIRKNYAIDINASVAGSNEMCVTHVTMFLFTGKKIESSLEIDHIVAHIEQ